MKRFGFTLATLITIGLLGYGGYLAIAGLTDPSSYVKDSKEIIGDLHRVATTTDDVSNRFDYETNQQEPVVATTTVATPEPASVGDDLLSRIKELETKNIVLKKGSRGPSVGVLQEFLNKYFNKTSKIDNDFGKGTETDVKKFQSQNGVTQTGQVGPQTFGKMITWLEKNN